MNEFSINGAPINESAQAGEVLPSTLGIYDRTVRARPGIAVEGAEVTVQVAETLDPAVIYTEGLDGSPEVIEQPLLTDVNGAFLFYAPFGSYRITVSFEDQTVILNDQLIGPSRKYTDGIGVFETDFSVLGDFADDAAAATGGVDIGSLYRTNSTVKVRIS